MPPAAIARGLALRAKTREDEGGGEGEKKNPPPLSCGRKGEKKRQKNASQGDPEAHGRLREGEEGPGQRRTSEIIGGPLPPSLHE